jgi:dTDP-4-amino-4,6-dideoxygalactose transaminase
MNNKIYLSPPHINAEELSFIKGALESNWIAPFGPDIDGFEKDIELYYNNQVHATALSSCTAAIHLGLIALGVKKGDEVICQSFTFIASANPILYLGATPVFVDSETDTWNISPKYLEVAIKAGIVKGKKPKAIVVVDLYGMPAAMPEIMDISKKYDIPVLEDAAEAMGSHINGQKCGSFGKLSVLSFNGNKIITSSGGGALLSHDPIINEKAHFLATQARDPAPYYQHSTLGYNYRLSNICASIGRAQMLHLPHRIAQRKAIYNFYHQKLSNLPGIVFQNELPGYCSNRWLTALLVKPNISGGITNNHIIDALTEANIESRRLWKPLSMQPLFSDCTFYGDGTAESLFNEGICLPSGSNLTIPELNRIVTIIRSLWKK